MQEATPKALLMTAEAMERAINRIAHEMIEQLEPLEKLVLVGIRRRGDPLARRLAAKIARVEGVSVPTGTVDATFYRDDLTREAAQPRVRSASLPVDINGRIVVLVDDVIYTGRTARAAMEALMKQGRPARVCLAVLVDRGHRELPIRPDFVGKNVPTARCERVGVHMREIDAQDMVALYAASGAASTDRQ